MVVLVLLSLVVLVVLVGLVVLVVLVVGLLVVDLYCNLMNFQEVWISKSTETVI